ncbi:serine/threonine protein kinase [bacterium]|nr:serine/threonine protein kinase [bacterium]MBP9808543.1 serine/threonine protein kinase [bacterium]
MKFCPKCDARFETLWSKCPVDGHELELEQADPMIGQVFADQYEIISVLGTGGMSVVYKARHRLMDRIVAIKLLHDDSDKVAIERFKHEAKASSALKHQNIISIYDFGIVGSQAYLVMDCLDGKNLSEVLDEIGHLALDRAVHIFRQTCMGLEHAHKNGILHRDLKPSNLVLIKGEDGSELVKIVDFGIAKVLPHAAKEQTRLTQTGDIFGSPLYMSPEQCQAKSLDNRSDIYSLGCLMYESLAGVAPLRGDTAYDTMTMHVSQTPRSFSEVVPELNINKSMEALIFRCLEKLPENRYQSITEVLQDLPTIQPQSGSVKVKAVQHPTKQRLEIKYLRYAFWTLFVFVAAVFAYMSCDNGPEPDHGTVLLKTIWNSQTTIAQTLTDLHLYDQAHWVLTSAENTARTKFSNRGRLMTALRMERTLFSKAKMFDELQVVNEKIATLNSQVLLEAYDTLLKELDDLAKPGSESQTGMKRILAPITFTTIDHVNRGLAGAAMDKHTETLLTKARTVYINLLGNDSPQVAGIDMLLAECYNRQQRLPMMRPLLAEALSIYVKAANNNNIINNNKNGRKRVLALIKLGQLDRDENRYEDAEKELKEAMNLAEGSFANDKTLLYQALNSYACYLAQTGKAQESKAIFAKADTIATEKLMQE